MNSVVTKILLIEDNPGDADLIMEMLIDAPLGQRFDIVHVERLNDGLERLWNEAFDLVFLDLSLPDSYGIDTVVRMNRELPDLPVMVLTGLNDELMAVKAMQYGAQDYLVKGQITQQVLIRAIRYSIERHRLLRSLALMDEMTSLYNRRGFVTLAEQHIRLANRTGTSFLLIFADMDGLKQINDTHGHHVGSQAIVEAAGLLRSVFRESDIIARLGGDEFAIIATDSLGTSSEIITERLTKQLEIRNTEASQPFQLELSIGIIRCDPPHVDTIVELLHNADEAMYKQKRDKKATQTTDDSAEFTPRLYGNIL